MSTTREPASPPTGTTAHGADSPSRPAAPIASVGALVSRRASSGFGAEPRSF